MRILISSLLLILTNTVFGCDCSRKSIGEKYISSELVYVGVIGDDHWGSSENFMRWDVEQLKVFKDSHLRDSRILCV